MPLIFKSKWCKKQNSMRKRRKARPLVTRPFFRYWRLGPFSLLVTRPFFSLLVTRPCFVTGDSAFFRYKLDKLENYDQLGPKINQNRSKNGPTWCQDGVQDGLLGIRAVKRRILDRDATATPPRRRFMRPSWEASWGHVGAHVGLILASFFVMVF